MKKTVLFVNNETNEEIIELEMDNVPIINEEIDINIPEKNIDIKYSSVLRVKHMIWLEKDEHNNYKYVNI